MLARAGYSGRVALNGAVQKHAVFRLADLQSPGRVDV